MMAALLRDELMLPASTGISFIDAATGQAVRDGLQCTLLRRRDGAALARASTTPSGVHHWPGLDSRWAAPDPLLPALADLRVYDLFERFLPLSLAWPIPAAIVATQIGGVRLAHVSLLSAPQRLAPPGFASVFAQLIWQDAAGLTSPAAWARVMLTDLQGRVSLGSCDAQGCLAVHLPLARPQLDPLTKAAFAVVAVKLFLDPGLALSARRLSAPDVLAWAAQTEVRALARADEATALNSLRLEVGRAAVPVTEGLLPRRSELRLVAL